MRRLKALLERCSYSRTSGSALWALPCPRAGRAGHCCWLTSRRHGRQRSAKAGVDAGRPAGPSSAQSLNLETPPSNIQWIKEMKVCPTTSSDHFAPDIKGSYAAKRLPGEGHWREGTVVKAKVSESGISRKAGRETQGWSQGRKDQGCPCPRRSDLPGPSPPLRCTDKKDVDR